MLSLCSSPCLVQVLALHYAANQCHVTVCMSEFMSDDRCILVAMIESRYIPAANLFELTIKQKLMFGGGVIVIDLHSIWDPIFRWL